jgi:hypothetical protein
MSCDVVASGFEWVDMWVVMWVVMRVRWGCDEGAMRVQW